MEQALKQYSKKSTTIGQMREDIVDFKSPTYVACVDPPFKASFFISNGVNKTNGAEKYFWKVPMNQKFLENTTYSAMDIYMNMSYQLGLDWKINLMYLNGLVYASIFLTKSSLFKHTVFPHIRPAGTIFSFHFYSKVTVHKAKGHST